ncbi:ImmA/IrrE family metallo-endopeptidase [Undibacterium sp. NL8W]|uniref:ImmA/IrrE family metallo-endopeptidase n=2 Tax=Undibacterium umbellatum TaxID=2762300 RepID=A0ABR6ZIN8_9BURK|nr:ImmA/IrrE family metallo-endopeptidase [Undibacterium umbellatum]
MGEEGAARELLNRYWDRRLPIDPVKIATAAGISVYGRGGWGEDYPYSGYYRIFNGIQSIEYNVSEAPVRQRFTVAHELGHFALGHEDAPRDVGNFQSSRDFRELQANKFAAELLMPASLVREHYLNGKAGSVEALANIFGVSKDAMGYRLINLRLI